MTRNATFASLALIAGCFTATASADNPQGACCWPDPDQGLICQVMTDDGCSQLGGFFYGTGSQCGDPFIECPAAPIDGACCFEDANGWQCMELEDYKCAQLGGAWYGSGVSCNSPQIVCPPEDPLGACCAYEGGNGQYWCMQLTVTDCSLANGYWYGPGISCSDPIVECEEPADPRGACCADEDGNGQYWCAQLTLVECSLANGYWYGPGISCNDPIVECEEPADPRGACCVDEDGNGQFWCSQLTLVECSLANGYWYGPGISCNDPIVECEEPGDLRGACCVDEDGNSQYWCLQLTFNECSLANGYWYGLGVACNDPMVECEEPADLSGACCADEDGDGQYWCVQLTLIDCSAANGYWYGAGIACSNPIVECEEDPEQCTVEPGSMCAGQPNYADAAFQANFGQGDIAVMTASPSIIGGQVITVFDLSDAVAAPTDSWFGLDRYSHVSWTQNTLGSIFGLAIDGNGVIYVSASRSWWMDVMGPAGWGGVYRVDPVTGAVSTFATLPNVTEGLGSMTFDCDNHQFFVSNFNDGLIYRLGMNGATLGTFDHGTPFNGVSPAALGDRPFGVEVHAGRLYYAMWNEDQTVNSASVSNEIWSVELDATGAPMSATAIVEVVIPAFQYNWSSPVSDIRFSPRGTMLLAERSMKSIDIIGAHDARALEYECVGGNWTPSANTFNVGIIPQSAAGGIDSTHTAVWASADAMHLAYQDNMYGLQGLPITGGSTANSVLIDYQDNLTNQDKTFLGDLVVVPASTATISCPNIWDLDIDCVGANPPYDFDITLGVSNMDANETITYVQLTAPSGMTLTPSGFPMNLPGQHSWTVDTLLQGANSGMEICLNAVTTFHDGSTCETVICIDLPTCNVLPADLNADGIVGVDDLMLLLGAFGDDCPDDCPEDIDGDGTVGIDDLLLLVSQWS